MGASCVFRTQTVSYDEIKESRVKEIRGTHLQDFVYIEVGNLSPLGGSWVLLYSNFIPCPCLWDLNFQWEVFPNLYQRYHCFWVWENVTLWMFFFFFFCFNCAFGRRCVNMLSSQSQVLASQWSAGEEILSLPHTQLHCSRRARL